MGNIVIVAGILVLSFAAAVNGQPTAHYVPGSEGLKGATLPPPGLYLRDYNAFYFSDRLNDGDGDEIDAVDFSTCVIAQVPRLLWITPTEFLGGYVGVDALWPLVRQDVDLAAPGLDFGSTQCGIGDPFLEATLSWHLPRFDIALGVGEWFPVGDSDFPPSAKPGLGYWTTMFTAGGTAYLDSDKTWALSVLGRYEINCENRDTNITPGDALTLEWGLSKSLTKTLDLGVVGYFQKQTTTDDGAGASNKLDAVASIGPEIAVAFPEKSVFLSLRYCYEFWAEDRAQGNTITLTATYRF